MQLYVTPIINEDGFVTMKIRPEVSSVARILTTSDGDEIPIVDTTTAETKVMVKDGHTIIIGGLIKDETVRTTKKIPILGDIPLLGVLFKQIDEDKEKTELVVFLTPHIITGDKDMPDWEEKEIKGLREYKHEVDARIVEVRLSEYYKVKKGETLRIIAKKIYGDPEKCVLIYRANKDKIKNADTIHPGQILRIPRNKTKTKGGGYRSSGYKDSE